MRHRLAEATSWSRSQQATRAVVLLGPVGALLAAASAGSAPPVWLVALVSLLAVLAAVAPDSGLPTAVLVAVVAWWAVADDPLHGSVLAAAAMLTAVHVASLLAAVGPPETPLDAALVRRWVQRGAAVLLVSPALWVVARELDGRPRPDGLWPAALAVVLVAVMAGAMTFTPSEESV